MKKIISLFVLVSCITLMLGVAFADDYSALSVEELQSALNAIRTELLTREPGFAENYVLYDEGGIKITLTGTYSARAHSFDKGVVVISFDTILINDSNNDIYLDINDCYVNGWSASASSELGNVKAGKKAKGEIRVDTSAVTEKGVDKELEEIELTFCFKNPENYKRLTDEVEKTVRFPLK